MARFLATRAVGAVGVLLVLITLVFVLQAVVPGDPVRARVGANASRETVARERHRLGFDRPLTAQYVSYVGEAVRGDLGESIRTSRSVMGDVGHVPPRDAGARGRGDAPRGRARRAARGARGDRQPGVRSAEDALSRRGVGTSVPPRLPVHLPLLPPARLASRLGTERERVDPRGPTRLLVLDGLLAGRPSVAWDAVQHLVLPSLALALLPAVAIGRVLRSSLVDVLDTDYVRTARAKGLRPRTVLRRHALRNALSAPLTMTGLQFGLMLGSVVVIETIFAWPGIGLYTDQSIAAGDLPAIAGVTLILAAIYVLVNVAVDVAQAVADPRVQL